jgi:rhomboid family GlyGly-CTERM serine protease
MTALCFLLQLAGEPGRLALRFDRAAIGGGEIWRLVSGHLVHLGWSHFGLNIAGLILVWLLVGRQFTAGVWCVVLGAAVAGIDAGLWFLDPGLGWYVGLSGVLHGMLMAGIVGGIRSGSGEAAILGVLILVKLFWEQFFGPLPGSENIAGAIVVVNAHLYGAIAGILAAELTIRARSHRPI